MKTIIIGRGDGCNITIDDDMISRRHAVLRISTFGKMDIVNMGKNGTFVNGVKLRPNIPFPVKRKDVVNFANVHQLDWSQVPNPLRYIKIGVWVAGGLVALLLLILLFNSLLGSTPQQPTPSFRDDYRQETAAPAASADSAGKAAPDSARQKEQPGKSIEQVLRERAAQQQREKEKARQHPGSTSPARGNGQQTQQTQPEEGGADMPLM